MLLYTVSIFSFALGIPFQIVVVFRKKQSQRYVITPLFLLAKSARDTRSTSSTTVPLRPRSSLYFSILQSRSLLQLPIPKHRFLALVGSPNLEVTSSCYTEVRKKEEEERRVQPNH